MSIDDFHRKIQLARPILTPHQRKDGFSYSIGTKRAIRISPCPRTGSLFLVKAASERANLPNARGPFSGTVAELLTIIDGEIARIHAEMPRRTPSARRLADHTFPKSTAQLRPARESIKDFVFERIIDGITGKTGLIYRWEIFDGDACVGVYIGLTDLVDPEERIARYRANVMGLQRGEPYSRDNPDGYRKVHRALEAALHAGHRIVLTYLDGHRPGLKLKDMETRYILEHKSYGTAPHQLNQAK